MSTFEYTISFILVAIGAIGIVLAPFVIARTRVPRTRRHPSF